MQPQPTGEYLYTDISIPISKYTPSTVYRFLTRENTKNKTRIGSTNMRLENIFIRLSEMREQREAAKRNKTLTVMVTEGERTFLKSVAKDMGVPYADLVRDGVGNSIKAGILHSLLENQELTAVQKIEIALPLLEDKITGDDLRKYINQEKA